MKVRINNATIDDIDDIQITVSDGNTEVCMTGQKQFNNKFLKEFADASLALGEGSFTYPEPNMWAWCLVYNTAIINIQGM